jgi:asparagine synthase (glutamine-hydrolysing)
VPPGILERPKQPYRAPDAASFTGRHEPEYIREVLSPEAVDAAGMFGSEGVGRLLEKCRSLSADGQLSNADNMAFVGVLSAQLVWDLLVRRAPPYRGLDEGDLTVNVDRSGVCD